MPGQALHKVPLFGWAIFVTAVLLLLSLPVLAGIIIILPALNSAMFWKQLYITQSAGNKESLSFLRIFRDNTPEFVCRILYFVCNKKLYSSTCFLDNYDSYPLKFLEPSNNLNLNFSSYLAGLIEGDGSIIVPKTERSDKGKLYYPSIQISFDLRDFPLAQIIQQRIRHGSLGRKKGVNAYVLTINNFEGIILVVNLINGYMRTPKIKSLFNLIDWLNNRFNINIEKKNIDNTSIDSNSWLSGFIDADGHFSVRCTSSSVYRRIECKFELTQRQIDHNKLDNYYFLSLIADFLNTSVKKIRMTKPKPEYRVRTVSLKGNLILIEYLDRFPLYSSKFLNYKDWIKVINYFKIKEHTKAESIKEIIIIKSKMNDKRTEFNWDHLQNFYDLRK
jgi:hypothetical protein